MMCAYSILFFFFFLVLFNNFYKEKYNHKNGNNLCFYYGSKKSEMIFKWRSHCMQYFKVNKYYLEIKTAYSAKHIYYKCYGED